MGKLYTQEELDKYFGGSDDISIRAQVYEQWCKEWDNRKISVHHRQLHEFFKFIKENQIFHTDYARKNSKKAKHVNIYFRHEEDYLAAILKFI